MPQTPSTGSSLVDRLLSQKENRAGADVYSGVRDWYRQSFGADIPVKNIGASDFERSQRHEHSRAFDIGVNPNSPRGQEIIKYLTSQGIPYSAFDKAIYKNGRAIATGPHIHVGPPSRDIGVSTPVTPQEPASQGTGSTLVDRLLRQKEAGQAQAPVKPLSKADLRASYYEQGSKARNLSQAEQARLEKMARDIEWHFGYTTLNSFQSLPVEQQQMIAKKAMTFAAIDEERKKSGYQPVKSYQWQEENRRKLGLILPEMLTPDEDAEMRYRERAKETNPLLRLSKEPFTDLLPSTRWLVDMAAQGGAGLYDFAAGAVKTFDPLLGVGAFTGAKIPIVERGKERVAEALKSGAATVREVSKEAEEMEPTSETSKFLKGLGSGAIEYAPMAALPEVGVEGVLARIGLSAATFGGYSGTQAYGRGESKTQIAKETGTGMALGSLFGIPLPGKGPLTKAISNLMITGGGATVINMATGQPWKQAAAQGLALSILRSPELLKGLKVKTETGEVRPATINDIRRMLPPAPGDVSARGRTDLYSMETGTPKPSPVPFLLKSKNGTTVKTIEKGTHVEALGTLTKRQRAAIRRGDLVLERSPQNVVLPAEQKGRATREEPGQGELFTVVRPGEQAGRADAPGFMPEPQTLEQFAQARGLDPETALAQNMHQEYLDKVKATAGQPARTPPRHTSWAKEAEEAEEAWKAKRPAKTKPNVDKNVAEAIKNARTNGPSPEFRAFFGGIEPVKAGTTIAKVRAFAKKLGIKWEPQEGWMGAEQQAAKDAKEAKKTAAAPAPQAEPGTATGLATVAPQAEPGAKAKPRQQVRVGGTPQPMQQTFTFAGPSGERVPIFTSALEDPQAALVRLTNLRANDPVWNAMSPEDRASIGRSIADLKRGKTPAEILDEAALSQQYPGVMRTSADTARRNLELLKEHIKKAEGADKEAMQAQIDVLEKQKVGELPDVTRETSPTEERTRPRFTTREQLKGMTMTPSMIRGLRRERVSSKGAGVEVAPDVSQTSVKANDPVLGDVDIPIWQVLGDQGGFLNLSDIVKAAQELKDKYPGLSEATYRALAINRLEKAQGIDRTSRGTWQPGQINPELSEASRQEAAATFSKSRQPMTRDQLIDHIQHLEPGQLAGLLGERLPPGKYERTDVPINTLTAPYVQQEAPSTVRYSQRGAAPEAPEIVVNDRGEVVAGRTQFMEAQAAGKTDVRVWKPEGVEIKAPEPWTGGQPDWEPEKRTAKEGVKVVKKGVSQPTAETEPKGKPAVGEKPPEAKPTGTTEPGTERYVLRVQKGPQGWQYGVFDTQHPEAPVQSGTAPTRDAAIQQGGAHTTRLNRHGEAGFINVGDAFDAVKDWFEGLPRGVDKDLWAATLKSLQSHEGVQAGLDVQKLGKLDLTFEAAEVAAHRLPKGILQDIMITRSRGTDETPKGKQIYRDAYQRLAAIKQPYLRDQVAKLAKAAQVSYDLIHSYGVGRGVDLAYRENYFRGLWRPGDAAKVDNIMQQWGTTEGYTKRKAILTVGDGLGYGLKLENYNPFTNARQELISIERRQAMKDLAKHVRSLKGVVVETKNLTHDDLMELRGQGWTAMQDTSFEGLLVAPEYAKYLNKMMGANFMSGKRPLRVMREISRTLQKAKFVGSIFHFKNMVKASIAAETFGIVDPRGYHDVWKAMRGTADLRNAGIDPKSPEHAEYVTLSGGYKRAMEVEGARSGLFGLRALETELNVAAERALTPYIGETGAKVGEAIRKVSTVVPGAPGFQRWQFNKFIPILKEIKYLRDLASEEAAKGRKLTKPEKLDIIKRNQNFYGEMNEQLLNRGRGMTSFLRIPFTAPGFGEGNIRTMARAIGEPLEAIGKLARGEKITKMDVKSAAFMINSWVWSAVSAQLATRILTGKWATPKTIREMFLFNTGDVDKDGAPIYFDMLSYDKDYWTMVGFMMNLAGAPKSFKEKVGVPTTIGKSGNEILQRVAGAEAPAMGALTMVNDLIMHRQIYDWRGRPILEEGNLPQELKAIGDQAADRFEPIMLSTIRQAMSAKLPTGRAIVYSVVGVRPVRKPGIYQLAHDYNVEHKHPARGVFEARQYQDLTDSLGRPGEQAAYDDLHKTEKRGQILKYYKDRTTRPITGNKEREAEFLKTLTPEQLQWYHEEYAKRVRDLRAIEKLTNLQAPVTPMAMPAAAKKPSVYDTP